MKSFCWLLQRMMLTLLLGAVPLTAASCGDDDSGTTPAVSVVLKALEISPSTATVAVNGKQVFELSSATVEVDGEEMTFDDGDLAEVIDDSVDVSDAQRDAIYAVLDTVTWTSSDDAVATVEKGEAPSGDAGVMAPSTTAEATGEDEGGPVTISATVAGDVADPADLESDDVVATATLTVGEVPVDSLSVSPDELTLAVGTDEMLEVTATTGTVDSDVTDDADYVSDNEAIATVVDGLVTGVTPGTTFVTVSYGGQTEVVSVTVSDEVVALVITGPESVIVGQEAEFEAEATFASDDTQDVTDEVEWTVDDDSVASLDENVATGLIGGEQVTITATLNGVTATATLDVVGIAGESLQVTPAEVSTPEGTTVQFSAILTNNDDTTENVTTQVTWSSSDEATATVDDDGVVTAEAVGGPVTITASIDGVMGTAQITVTDAEVLSLSVQPEVSEVALGINPVFTAFATYTNGQTVNVSAQATWTSSEPGVATVAGGQTETLSVGDTVITATFDEATASAALEVTDKTVTEIVVADSPATTNVGIDIPFSATAHFTDGTTALVTNQATWASSETGIATIDSTGLATPIAAGATTISATFASVTGTAVLSVTGKATVALEVTPPSATLAAGQKRAARAEARFSDNTVLDVTSSASWTSDDTAVATVSETGVITGGTTTGTAIITATFDGQSDAVAVTVTDAVVQSIAVTPNNPNVPVGLTTQLTATATYSDGTTDVITGDANVTWSSSAVGTATVANVAPNKGRVTGVAAGSATITATYADGINPVVTGSRVVNVTGVVPVSITVLPTTAAVPVSFTVGFRAEATLSDNSVRDVTNNVSWSSGSQAIATVSAQGVATGIAAGVTNITATLPQGDSPLTGSASLTVQDRQLASIQVKPASGTIAKGGTRTFEATGHFNTGAPIDITDAVSWTVVQPEDCVANDLCVPTAGDDYVTISNDSQTKGIATAVESTVNAVEEHEEFGTVYTATIRASLNGVLGTATLGVTSNVIVAVDVAVVDDALNEMSDLAIGQTLRLIATCTFQDGRTDENCASRITFTASNNSATIDNTNKRISGVSAGTVQVSALPPTGATADVGINTVSIDVLDCAYDTLTVETSPSDLPLGATGQAQATLSESGESPNCDPVVLTSAVSWQSGNADALDVDQQGNLAALATPVPPPAEWPTMGDAPGLAVNVLATYIKGNTTLTGTGSVTLRDACIDELVVTPAINSTMPIIADDNAYQQLNVVGRFSIDIEDAVLTGGDLGYEFDAANLNVTGAGVVEVDTSAAAGPQTITVNATELDIINGSPICPGGATGSVAITLSDSALTGLDVTVQDPVIGLGGDTQMTAIASFADGNVGTWNVTDIVTWTSSNEPVLTVGPAGFVQSLVSGGQGSSVITGTLGNLSDAVTVEARDRTLVSVTIGTNPDFADDCDFVDELLPPLGVAEVELPTPGGVDGPVPTDVRLPFIAIATWSDDEQTLVTDQTVFTASQGPSLVSVSGNGVTTVAAGTTAIRGTFDGVQSAPLQFSISVQAVTDLAITPEELDAVDHDTMADGTSRQYGAVATWASEASCDVTAVSTWSVTPPGVGTSPSPGLIQLVPDNSGEDVDFTAVYQDTTAVRNILVGNPCVASISLPSQLSLAEDSSANLAATVTLSDGSPLVDPTTVIDWSSDNPAIATTSLTTNLTGTVQGEGVGTTVVRANYDEEDNNVPLCEGLVNPLMASTNVTVSLDLVEVVVDCDSETEDTDGPNFSTGTLKNFGLEGPTAELPVGVRGYCTATAHFTSGPPQDVTETATWTAMDPALVSMTDVVEHDDGTGNDAPYKTFLTIDAAAEPTSIQATFDGMSGSDSFTVLQPTEVTVLIRETRSSSTSLGLQAADEELPLFETGTYSKAYEAVGIFTTISGGPHAYDLTDVVDWTSSALNVATITAPGVVLPVGEGASVITASHAASGASDTLTVTVSGDSCGILTIHDADGAVAGDPDDEELALGQTAQFTATCELADSGEFVDVTELATWSSQIPARATVTSTGLVQASNSVTGTGDTVITANVGGVTSNFTLTVNDSCIEDARIVETLQGFADGASIPVGVPVSFQLEVRRSNSDSFVNGSFTQSFTVPPLADPAPTVSTSVTFCGGDANEVFTYTRVDPDVTSVVVSPGSASVPQGGKITFSASATFAGSSDSFDVTTSDALVWGIPLGETLVAITNEEIGEVTANVAEETGTTTVTATLNEDESGVANLTVTDAVLTSIRVELFQSDADLGCVLPSSELSVEESSYFDADGASHPRGGFTTRARTIGVYSDDDELPLSDVTYSDNSGSTTIDPSTGVITTGSTPGSVLITATDGTFSDTITLNVVDATLSSVTVQADTGLEVQALPEGQSAQLQLVGDFGGSDFCITPDATWLAPTPNAAVSLSTTGVVTGNSVGSNAIQGGIGGVTDLITVTVTDAAIFSIEIVPASLGLTPNSTGQLRAFATLTDSSVIEVTSNPTHPVYGATWSVTSGPVSVSNGLVTSTSTLGAAVVTIEANADSGINADANVTVANGL